MKGHCDVPGCYPDGPCVNGEEHKSQCKHFTPAGPEASSVPDTEGTDHLVQWNGHVLGVDLSAVAGRGRPTIIGLAGPHEAGKTTFLVVLYCALLQGRALGGCRFAGSFTLAAWEELAAWVRPAIDRPARFPPRTSASSLASAGLLHLALRGERREVIDLLLTDAPGEWFKKWAIRADSDEAAGARWIADAADGFLVFADSQRLRSEERGPARGDITLLMERLASVRGERPAALVWSKSDLTVPDGIRDSVSLVRQRALPDAPERRTNYRDPDSIVAATSAILERVWAPRRGTAVLEPLIGPDPFYAFRG